jgi:hypothetical protein
MSEVTIRPSVFTRGHTDVAMFIMGMGLLAGIVALSFAAFDDAGDALIRNTIRLSLAWLLVALLLMLRLRREAWAAGTPLGRIARWCWAWGCVVFLVHLWMAFHYYHHWSWRHALEHTRRVAGVGEGIYVSYMFTWLWIADAAWWWARPASYAQRSAWIGRALHGFMLFIVFNGTVIYETGPIRYAGLGGLLILVAEGLNSFRERRSLAKPVE